MHYVSEEAAKKAREYEERFQKLPPMAGIIFVSVVALPVEGGHTRSFDVTLGIARSFDPQTGVAIIKKVLEEEISRNEVVLRVARCVRGVSGTACDYGERRMEISGQLAQEADDRV